METIKVFVYGTLRKGCSNHHVIERYIVESQPFQVTGRLYDVGFYPALVLDERETIRVQGELVTVNAEALTSLDFLEGYKGPNSKFNLYERILHPEGFYVYTWSQKKVDEKGLKQIINGDWVAYSQQKKEKIS